MTFADALKEAISGAKIARSIWPKNQYLQVQACLIMKNTNLDHSQPLLYNAGQNDLLGDDWEIVGEEN